LLVARDDELDRRFAFEAYDVSAEEGSPTQCANRERSREHGDREVEEMLV